MFEIQHKTNQRILADSRASKTAAAKEESRRQEQELKRMAEEQEVATKVAQASTGVLLEPALSSEQKEAQVRAKAQASEARETARRIAARKAELARQAKLDRQRHEDEMRVLAVQERKQPRSKRRDSVLHRNWRKLALMPRTKSVAMSWN